jgi:putative transposase
MAEVRLFHRGKFLCRAICPELAGQTIALRDIRHARDQRRRELRATLRDRHETVEALLDLRRGSSAPERPAARETEQVRTPILKRYHNE